MYNVFVNEIPREKVKLSIVVAVGVELGRVEFSEPLPLQQIRFPVDWMSFLGLERNDQVYKMAVDG